MTVLTLCSRFTSPSLYSWLPSIIPVSGLENHSLNSRWDWKTCGMRKCMSDHSSIRLFCSGVPVSSSRRWLHVQQKQRREIMPEQYQILNKKTNRRQMSGAEQNKSEKHSKIFCEHLLKFSRLCQRWDLKFLMFCASSRMRYFHDLRLNAWWSCKTSLYEVMHTWKALGLVQP